MPIRCRSCNTLLDFKAAKMMQIGSTKNVASGAVAGAAVAAASSTVSNGYAKDCPPDVSELGKSTWTLLHSMAAKYPDSPTSEEQRELSLFINILSKMYPCSFCASDFRDYLKKNAMDVSSKDLFGKWLCGAHNEVNIKLGKPVFDCNLWKERWKDGWKDGSCD